MADLQKHSKGQVARKEQEEAGDYNICPQGSCGGPCGPLPPNPGKTCMVEPQPYGTEPKFIDHESKSNVNNIEEPYMEPLSHEVDHKPLNVENAT